MFTCRLVPPTNRWPFGRRRHPQGCDLRKSPLPPTRVATCGRPDAPLGFLSTSCSRTVPDFETHTPKEVDPRHSDRGPTRPAPPLAPPKRNQRTSDSSDPRSVRTAQTTPEGPALASRQGTRTLPPLSRKQPSLTRTEVRVLPSAPGAFRFPPLRPGTVTQETNTVAAAYAASLSRSAPERTLQTPPPKRRSRRAEAHPRPFQPREPPNR